MRNPSVSAWARQSVAIAACLFGAAGFAVTAAGQDSTGGSPGHYWGRSSRSPGVLGTLLCPPIKPPPRPHDPKPYQQSAEKQPTDQRDYYELPVDPLQAACRPPDKPTTCANTFVPLTLAVQSGTAVVAAGNFTGSIFGRLDGLHQQGLMLGVAVMGGDAEGGSDGMMGLGRNSKSRAKRPALPSPLTTYAMGTFAGGSRSGVGHHGRLQLRRRVGNGGARIQRQPQPHRRVCRQRGRDVRRHQYGRVRRRRRPAGRRLRVLCDQVLVRRCAGSLRQPRPGSGPHGRQHQRCHPRQHGRECGRPGGE